MNTVFVCCSLIYRVEYFYLLIFGVGENAYRRKKFNLEKSHDFYACLNQLPVFFCSPQIQQRKHKRFAKIFTALKLLERHLKMFILLHTKIFTDNANLEKYLLCTCLSSEQYANKKAILSKIIFRYSILRHEIPKWS